MVDIVICGANGKMGRTVYNCINERNDCKVIAGIDLNTEVYADFPIYKSFDEMTVKPDVIIDFSHPSSLKGIIEYGLVTGTPVVFTTTGYSCEDISAIKNTAQQIPVFFSWNMSIGINLMVELAKKAAVVLGDQFDVEIIEKHHNQKIDAPSGTALMLANAINDARNNCYNYTYDRHSQRKKRDKNEIGIHSVRGGSIVGEHEILFAGKDECISLSHSATSKTVFAVGAVNAAVFLKDKTAGLYDMSDLV